MHQHDNKDRVYAQKTPLKKLIDWESLLSVCKQLKYLMGAENLQKEY